MRAATTASETSMFSARAIVASLFVVELESRGLKRNLEQREASGSIILRIMRHLSRIGEGLEREDEPCHVVADEAEAGDAGVGFHDSAEGGLGVLGH